MLGEAGCSLHRDAHDRRLVAAVRSLGKEGHIIRDPALVGGYGVLEGGQAPLDSDGDGMPDAWELAHGLDPHTANDRGQDLGGGYTNLEHYLAELAEAKRD